MPGLIIAQAAAEYGLVSSIGAGLTRLRYEIDGYLGDNASYVIAGAVVLLAFLLLRRRR